MNEVGWLEGPAKRLGWFGSVVLCVSAFAAAAAGQEGAAGDWLSEARRLELAGQAEKAEQAASEALRMDSSLVEALYLRGRARFRLDRMTEAIEDLDQYVKARPDIASRQWERGIALYYAGRFADGASQFQLYQTYHDNDVENSVWRFLCMARDQSVAAARSAMLPIKDDPRVPMMEIYGLYRGQGSPEKVMAAVEQGSPSERELRGRRFYAHLYLGLFHEALQDDAAAERHLRQAAGDYSPADPINGFMWAVSDVHVRRLQKQREADRVPADRRAPPDG